MNVDSNETDIFGAQNGVILWYSVHKLSFRCAKEVRIQIAVFKSTPTIFRISSTSLLTSWPLLVQLGITELTRQNLGSKPLPSNLYAPKSVDILKQEARHQERQGRYTWREIYTTIHAHFIYWVQNMITCTVIRRTSMASPKCSMAE